MIPHVPRRSFLGCVFGGAAAVTLQASGLQGAVSEVSKTLILPSAVADQLSSEPSLVITSMDDPRASAVSRSILTENSENPWVWFGMPDDRLRRMKADEYSAWLASHVRVNRDFGYEAAFEYQSLQSANPGYHL